MEQKQISLETLAKWLYNLELEVGKLKQQKDERSEDIDGDYPEKDFMWISQDSLAKEWLTPEEDKAWKDL